MHGNVALQRSSAAVTNLLCLQTQKQKLVWKVALFTFQQYQPCSTKVDVLKTCDVPIFIIASSVEKFSYEY